MPIYEYRCESCDHKLEHLQRMSEGNLVDCPACERPALKRLISAAAFRLKGSGWYETDFKQDNKRNLAGSEADSASGDTGDKGTAGKTASGTDSTKTDQAGTDKTGTGKAGTDKAGKTDAGQKLAVKAGTEAGKTTSA